MNGPHNGESSLSVYDLNAPSSAQALRQRRNRQMGYLMAFLLAAILLHGIFQRDKPSDIAQSERVEKIEDGFDLTKSAYGMRTENGQLSLNIGTAAKPQAASRVFARDVQRAIDKWRSITKLDVSRRSDWRRLGIAQAIFGQPEALRTFHHLPDVPLSYRTASKTATGVKPVLPTKVKVKVRPTPAAEKPTVPMAEEIALWDALYGKNILQEKQVPALRSTIERLDLRWFESVVLADLYAKAGMKKEARQAENYAQASVGFLDALTTFRGLAFMAGFPALFLFYGVLLRKPKSRLELEPGLTYFSPPTAFVSAAPSLKHLPEVKAPPRFSYHSRMMAFVSYMGLPLVLTLPLIPLFDLLTDWPVLNLTRLEIVLESGISWLLLLIALLILRRVDATEKADESPGGEVGERPSLGAILGALGLRSHRFGADILTGLVGFTTTMPLLIIASIVSNWLFARYQTPPHPVLLSIVEMNTPFDRLLLLFETAVTAPIVEEILFRGVLYPALRQRWGVAGGIAISSAIFALVHPTLPGGFLPLWTLGACFAFTFERRGSLWPNIVMHAMNNGLLLLVQFATLSK